MSQPETVSVDVVASSRALLGVVARSLAGALDQVTLPQFRLLVVLATRGPLRAGILADEIGTSPSTLTRTVDRLVRDGWVRREVNPESRRETRVFPTERALALVHEVTVRRTTEIEAILARMPEGEREHARRGFAVFAAAAGEPTDGDLRTLGMTADL